MTSGGPCTTTDIVKGRLVSAILVTMWWGTLSFTSSQNTMIACDHYFELMTKTVCGDCTMVRVWNSTSSPDPSNQTIKVTCAECHFNIPTQEIFTTLYPKSPTNWGHDGCTMFDPKYISKHPFLSSLMIAVVLIVCWMAVELIWSHYKHKRNSGRTSGEIYLDQEVANRGTHSSQGSSEPFFDRASIEFDSNTVKRA